MVESSSPAATSVTFLALLIGLAGQLVGEYVWIAVCALAGAWWPISEAMESGRKTSILFITRIVFTAFVLAGIGAWALEHFFKLPAVHGMAAVAFLIGMMGNGWRPVIEATGSALAFFVGRLAGKPADSNKPPANPPGA